MAEIFKLDPILEQDSHRLGALGLSLLLLKRDGVFPWLILVPCRAGLSELSDLTDSDAALLMQEIRKISTGFQQFLGKTRMGTPDKLNIAALGNQVRQLHVHIIARYKNDPAWPNPVWSLPHRLAKFANESEPNSSNNFWQSAAFEQTKSDFFAKVNSAHK